MNSHAGRTGFSHDHASVSLSIRERCWAGPPLNPVVREIRGPAAKDLGRTSVIGLYVGYAKGLRAHGQPLPLRDIVTRSVSEETTCLPR